MQRKCGVRGRTELHEQESMTNKNKNPVEGEWRVPEGRRGDGITPLGNSHKGGGEGRWGS